MGLESIFELPTDEDHTRPFRSEIKYVGKALEEFAPLIVAGELLARRNRH